jgi:tRNA pseudouridine55 synthase
MEPSPLQPGIHLLHKPIGPSSFAALSAVAPKNLRSCHGGTLDPFASGLLLVLVQPATQLFDLLHDVPKVYDVAIAWGIETENGDPTGTITRRAGTHHLTPEAIVSAMSSMIGWQDQTPPATSAKRIDGVRAYELAHRGTPITPPPTRVYLHSAQWLEHTLPATSRVRMTVRGGFYIRSCIADLGRRLDSAAHVAALHRISIGPYVDPHASTPSNAPALPWLPTRILTEDEVHTLKEGQGITIGNLIPPPSPLPEDFPMQLPLVRGIQNDRFSFVLEPRDGLLFSNRLLRGGIPFVE